MSETIRPAARCHITGNLCGTDTWVPGKPCRCPACTVYMARRWAEGNRFLSDESGAHASTVLVALDALDRERAREESVPRDDTDRVRAMLLEFAPIAQRNQVLLEFAPWLRSDQATCIATHEARVGIVLDHGQCWLEEHDPVPIAELMQENAALSQCMCDLNDGCVSYEKRIAELEAENTRLTSAVNDSRPSSPRFLQAIDVVRRKFPSLSLANNLSEMVEHLLACIAELEATIKRVENALAQAPVDAHYMAAIVVGTVRDALAGPVK